MHTLDTNAIIYYLKGDKKAVPILRKLFNQPQAIYISAITRYLKLSPEIKILAQIYLSANIIPKDYINDAIQIATASVNKLDILLSWNFRHMVNLRVKTKINAINVLYNYPQIDIAAPGELL